MCPPSAGTYNQKNMRTDFLVIGSGIAGLNFALGAAELGKVVIVTKKKSVDCGTNFAQGGIAGVLKSEDSFEKHISDTIKAGAGINNKKAVEFMVKNAPEAIEKLMNIGVEFAKKRGELLLTKEGGHCENRIAYVGDYTGKEIEKALVSKVKNHPNIKIFENAFAVDLMVAENVCYGSFVIHEEKSLNIYASQTVLTTGGSGQLFTYTTNPPIATGDGVAMALRAGCVLENMEFVQFHPTALAKKLPVMFLLSETLRGEGGKLINKDGKRFLKNDLASRDEVARGIFEELKNGPVYLDITHKKSEWLKLRFPSIYAQLKKYGFDMAKDPIPVTPAAHYQCGGVKTDLFGRTNIKNLFAFGEVACAGVHGANRLASNSLSEAVVFGNQILKQLNKIPRLRSKEFPSFEVQSSSEVDIKLLKKIKKKIREIMWKYGGIVRNIEDIESVAIPEMNRLKEELCKIKTVNPDVMEVKNMILVGLEILNSAQKRKKSLGCHFV